MAENRLLPLEVRQCQWVPGNTEPSPLCITSSSDRTSQLASLEGHIHVVPFLLPPPLLPFLLPLYWAPLITSLHMTRFP